MCALASLSLVLSPFALSFFCLVFLFLHSPLIETMRPISDRPWDIYTEQMMRKGLGYPLWTPDQPGARSKSSDANPGSASRNVRGPCGVLLGDVGWVSEGVFHVLFNALHPPDSGVQPQENMVPKDFVPLSAKGLRIYGPRETIRQETISSGTTRELGGAVEGQIGRRVAHLTCSLIWNLKY